MESGTHIAFTVESEHGHINPILGIMAELVRRGHRVTCPVREYFAPRVAATGAEPLVYKPLDPRVSFAPRVSACGNGIVVAIADLWKEYEREELDDALPQLETLYRQDRPDLIVYDFRNLAGKALADSWGIKRIEHAPMLINSNEGNHIWGIYDESMVLVSIPRFFQGNADALDGRFRFVGPSFFNGKFFKPWKFENRSNKAILVSATTSILQPEFFKLVIKAFENLGCGVILSIGDSMGPDSLGPLPSHFQINQFSSHLDILEDISLLVFQGGPRGALEALYRGVPMLVLPESFLHKEVADRVVALGVGISMNAETTSAQQLREATAVLLADEPTLSRVKEIQKTMHENDGAKSASDLILCAAYKLR